MNIAKNIELFQELVSCGSDIYTWCYDALGTLLYSNCPNEALFNTAFSLFGCKQQMLDYGANNTTPVTLGSAAGVSWRAVFEKENDALRRIYVIGPVFYHDVSFKAIEDGMRQYNKMEVSIAWSMQFYEAIKKIPVAQSTIMSRYTLMLHYCITGTKLQVSDLNYNEELPPQLIKTMPIKKDRHKIWSAEQALLQMVRNGDLNYKQALSNSMMISSGVPVESHDAMRQSKISIIVFISIVCRAAIEGGLLPEEAYSLGDSYIQSVESAKSLIEIEPLAVMMYDDFIHRVNKCRTNPKLSKQIKRCCDYIEMNLNQKIRANDLAVLVGYTEYYLTHKFKEETGLCVNDFIKFVKIERAKMLLQSTDLSIQDISDELCFGTRNYFSRIFSEVVGFTPAQYRQKHSTT